jgi:hypothetical protein
MAIKPKKDKPAQTKSSSSESKPDVVERSGGLGGGKGAARNAAKYEKSTAKERAKSNSDGRYGYFDDKLKTYVPARIDMQNGGGADMFDNEFKGHPIYSTLLNALGVKPYGSERERPYGGAYQAPAIAQAMNNPRQGGGAARPAAAAAAPQQAGPADFYNLQGNPAMNRQMPMGSYNATDMNLGFGMQPAGAQQSSPMDFYNLQGNPAMQAPQSSLQSSFAPYVPPAGTNVVTATDKPVGAPYSSGGDFIKGGGDRSIGLPPKGMDERMYSSWLRNQGGAINVDKMNPEGLRIMYQNYQNSPMF